jgi:PKHD-type hydroxylase
MAAELSSKMHLTVTVPRHFTPEECAAIVALGLSRTIQDAMVTAPRDGGQHIDRSKRSNAVAWFKRGEAETEAIFAKLGKLAHDINKEVYRFDLKGFGESLQFTRYERIGDSYTWHKDLGGGGHALRKLSLVVQLSDPATYRGCDLQTFEQGEPRALERSQGSVLIVPSWTLHRVSALEAGVRYSLVAWVGGDPFR